MSNTEKKQIAMVIYEGLTPFDLIGPLQVFSTFCAFAPQHEVLVVAERAGRLRADNGLQFVVERTFADAPRPHVLFLPGGGTPTEQAMSNPAIRRYVRETAQTTEFVTSACTGSLILAAVGLLNGRTATTHWAYRSFLDSLGARYQPKRWVEDGKFITAAGVSAGIDGALYIVSRLADEQTARQVQKAMHYDPQPPFGGIAWGRLDVPLRAMRAINSMRAPFATARPKALTRQGR